MSGNKVVYFEKYSVAPSPSRDYYGIKVFHDEIVLFVWRISHGPHVTPAVHVTKFFEFAEDKSLQEQICQVFGKPLLLHIKSLTLGKCETLLALPKNLINKISEYLDIQDIVKLSSLSQIANQIFNDNELWKNLCERCLNSNIFKRKNDYVGAKEWRNLMKDHQTRLKIRHEITDSVKGVEKQFRKNQEIFTNPNRAVSQNLKQMKTMSIYKIINNSDSKKYDTKKNNSYNQTNNASCCKIKELQTLRDANSIGSVQSALPIVRLHPPLQINKSLQEVRSESIKEEKRLGARCMVKKQNNLNPEKFNVSNETKTERFKDTSNTDPKISNLKKDKANRKSKQVQNNYISTNTIINKTGNIKKLQIKTLAPCTESNTTKINMKIKQF